MNIDKNIIIRKIKNKWFVIIFNYEYMYIVYISNVCWWIFNKEIKMNCDIILNFEFFEV